MSYVWAIRLIKRSDHEDSSQRAAVWVFGGLKDGLTCSEYISLS